MDMKKPHFMGLLCCIFYFLMSNTAYSGNMKMIKVGKRWQGVVDFGGQGQPEGSAKAGYYYYDKFFQDPWNCRSWQIGTKDWNDKDGKYWPVKESGTGLYLSDQLISTVALKDNAGISIRRYFRYTPPTITVDGYRLDEPFPMKGDEVNPNKIPGTADVMVESWLNTDMGLTIHQRVLAWSQIHHSDYIIYDWTFINTGNIDLDQDIELPNQTLKDLYYSRQYRISTGDRYGWVSSYGEYPTDSLRIGYFYSSRRRAATWDNFGGIRTNDGYPQYPQFIGEAFIHVDKSVHDSSDDPTQPEMTCPEDRNIDFTKYAPTSSGPAVWLFSYRTMSEGFLFYKGVPEMVGAYPGTHHSLRMDERGVKFPDEFTWFGTTPAWFNAFGPFTLAHGDSFRIVWADVIGSISPEKGWELGRDYLKGTVKAPPGMELGKTDNLSPVYKLFPELYAKDSKSSQENNWAKDCWIATGKDSLFRNAWNAQWNVRNNYTIPIPPPPPSIEIQSMPNNITILWGNESESASDFAGYRVYRAVGIADTTYSLLFECGEGTAHPQIIHKYEDASAQRGQAYFYYVAAFDNGLKNGPDARRPLGGERLESGKYLNRTIGRSAHLTRSAGSLSSARVVPNPFNISAKTMQYIGEPDKIMFMNLPPVCTIQIYSESGDLVKVLNHTNGSGDEPWGNLLAEHSVSKTGQVIVSGIYIANIQTPSGESVNLKFLVIR